MASLAACSDSTTEPGIDCSPFVGSVFIELEPPPSGGFVDYQINVGDSIQVSGSLRRVDAMAPTFNVQLGWSCVTSASSPVAGVVSLSATDTTVVRLHSGGWIRGASAGLANVTASSATPAASTNIGVLVHSP